MGKNKNNSKKNMVKVRKEEESTNLTSNQKSLNNERQKEKTIATLQKPNKRKKHPSYSRNVTKDTDLTLGQRQNLKRIITATTYKTKGKQGRLCFKTMMKNLEKDGVKRYKK